MTHHSQLYDRTLPAGGVTTIAAVGEYVKVMSAAGRVQIRLDSGELLEALPGQGLSRVSFRSVEMKDLSGAPNPVVLLVARANHVDDRISGEVLVADPLATATRELRAFSGSAAVSPGAGNFGALQLWNPGTSTKRLMLREVHWWAQAAALLYVGGFVQAALATDTWTEGNHDSLGDQGAGQIRSQASVANPVITVGGALLYVKPLVNEWRVHRFMAPVAIEPGYGFNLHCIVQNTDFEGLFCWTEENR